MNWFGTLNEALDAEGLVELWPIGRNINYGETKTTTKNGIFISVYRNEHGFYERPIHYRTKMNDY